MVHRRRSTTYKNSGKIGISETKYSRVGLVGETISVHCAGSDKVAYRTKRMAESRLIR